MKIFVSGVNGQLGHDVMLELRRQQIAGIGSGRAASSPVADMPYVSLDITSSEFVSQILGDIRPDVVIHCAAWTAVDAAELTENREIVRRVNEDGTKNLAQCCKALDCKMIYISTDYVFGGSGETPWDPDCKNFAPQNWYGQTKLLGEMAVSGLLEKYFIVRTAWVFGAYGGNFVKTMLKIGKTKDTLRVVDDQIGTPTYTPDLARLLVQMAGTEKYGFYHATNEGGFISWYDFANQIFRAAGYSTKVIPVTTAEYGLSIAARPLNSRLSKEKLTRNGFAPLPDWKNALNRYLQTYDEES